MQAYGIGNNQSEKFGFDGSSYFFQKYNIIGKTVNIIKNIFQKYFFLIYFGILRIKDKKNEENFTLILCYIVILLNSFQAFFYRHMFYVSFLVTIYIIRNYKKKKSIYFEIFTVIIVSFQVILWKEKLYFFTGINDFIFSIPLFSLLGI
ncbi:MAG: hypothetical protein ACTJGM_03800 [Fusobacterium sp.]